MLGEPEEARPGLVGDAVRDPVDQVEAAGHLVERAVEAEEADDAVDVEGEYRAVSPGTGGGE